LAWIAGKPSLNRRLPRIAVFRRRRTETADIRLKIVQILPALQTLSSALCAMLKAAAKVSGRRRAALDGRKQGNRRDCASNGIATWAGESWT
jgi:hypothetical protein